MNLPLYFWAGHGDSHENTDRAPRGGGIGTNTDNTHTPGANALDPSGSARGGYAQGGNGHEGHLDNANSTHQHRPESDYYNVWYHWNLAEAKIAALKRDLQLAEAQNVELNKDLQKVKNINKAVKPALQSRQDEITVLEARLTESNNQNQRIQEELKQTRAELKDLRSVENERREEVNALRETVRDLENQVKECDRQLMVEEVKLRSWTDVRLRDSDPSNPVKLREGLDDLRCSIRKLAMVKGSKVKINFDAARDVMKKCLPPEFTAIKDEKHVLTSVLQQLIFRCVETTIQKFPDDLDTDANLERKIANSTNTLHEALSRFVELRTPNDPAAGALPTRIRQQVFSYVGQRCFEANGHLLVKAVVEKLLTRLDQYRTIRSERRATARVTAERIVKNYVSLFLFHLNAQPGDLTIKWIEPGAPYDEHRMDSESTVNESMLVAVCAFPLIEDEASGTVYNKAEVLAFTPSKRSRRSSGQRTNVVP